ncbi:ABC transporter ATP-binding protein [bacterium]|nr:ABC transporter ATP-binding protein [bacterium]
MSNAEIPLIEMTGLNRIYTVGTEEVHAVRDMDLIVKTGEYLSIMGASGSGKSTLMNLIGCLDTPTSGNYLLNGLDVSVMNDDELATIRNREIGFVFQTFNLLARSTAAQNIELPLIYGGVSESERKQRVAEAVEAVSLTDRAHHKPNELSGGQRQRVAIARALVCNPSLLLADEPTGNLDSKTSEEIMGLLDDLNNKGHTIIVVTHEEDIAKHTNRIIRLIDGVISSDSSL